MGKHPQCIVSKNAKSDCSRKADVEKCLEGHRSKCTDLTDHLSDENTELWLTGANCRKESNDICTINVSKGCEVWGCYRVGGSIIPDQDGNPLFFQITSNKEARKHHRWKSPTKFRDRCRKSAKRHEVPKGKWSVRCFDWINVG